MSLCQSCGMPMNTEELKGKNVDGTVNEDTARAYLIKTLKPLKRWS